MNLPYEIFQLITTHLTNQDQYNCLLINKNWYKTCQRILYQSIEVQTRHQFKLLLQTLTEQKGRWVRVIRLEGKYQKMLGLTNQDLEKVTRLCPYLEVLDFDSRLWWYLKKDLIITLLQKLTCLQRLPEITRAILPSNAINLSSLTVSGGEAIQELIDKNMLQFVPRLKQLILKSDDLDMTIRRIEWMHQTLPLLEQLHLIGSVTQDYYHHPTTMTMAPPAYKMRTFKATISCPWMNYISQKYPNIYHLDLNCTLTEEAQQIFISMINRCQQLRILELNSTSAKNYLTNHFFDTVTHLKDIKIKTNDYNLVPRGEFYDLLCDRGQDLITTLGTEVIEADVSILTIKLSQFSRLSTLMLHCGQPLFDCPFDLVLQQCPLLQNLTIKCAHVMLQDNKKEQLQYRLKKLILSNVTTTNAIFDCLAGLNILSLYECDFIENVITICLPQARLGSVIINSVRTPFQSNATMIQVQGDWYQVMDDCYCTRKRLKKGRKVHNNDVVINCQSIQQWNLIWKTNFNEY